MAPPSGELQLDRLKSQEARSWDTRGNRMGGAGEPEENWERRRKRGAQPVSVSGEHQEADTEQK